MSWIFRYLTVMFYVRLLSGVGTTTLSVDPALHMENVGKLKIGTSLRAQILLIGRQRQCRGPPRQIREASPFSVADGLVADRLVHRGLLTPENNMKLI
jgi:hypothetical protein